MESGEETPSADGAPSPYVGAGVIAAGLFVLVMGVIYLNRDDTPTRLAVPTVDGVTLPTDSDGRPVDVPPSQPATAVAFGADGTILRPDPVRARIVDESGVEILITLPPNTTIDAITGDVIPRPPGTSGSTTVTTGPSTTPSSGPATTNRPPTTGTPTTNPPTTQPPTTAPPTTEPPTTEPPTTEPPTTEPPTTEPPPPTTEPPLDTTGG